MTGNDTTPGAVHRADSTHFYLEGPYVEGPLSWMIASSACRPAPYPPFKAVWRSETGTAKCLAAQLDSTQVPS